VSPETTKPQSFSWGEAYAYETDIRARVLTERIAWFITIRWGVVLLCAVLSVAAAVRLVPARLDWRIFAGVAVFLAGINFVYRWAKDRTKRKRRLMMAQMLTDFLAISVLSYALGSIETPAPLVYVAHVILAALFFSPWRSLVLTGVGFVFALAPVALERLGWLPVVAVLDPARKTALLADTRGLLLYAAVLGGCYLFVWYLTATITGSLKLRERQLEESNQKLEQLDEEKTQYTLRATHELKAPFAAIKTYVYSLRDGYCGDLPPKAQEVVGRIGDRCDRLTNMITAIIHVGNLRTAVVSDADFEPLDLAQFLPAEIDDAEVWGLPRKITVKSEIPAGAPQPIRASKRHLHTLVSNLLRNAVTYSHDGGEIEVSLVPGRESVVLRIADHGIGIARENIPKIFDDFYRSNEAARVNPHGNGLGLALVKEAARIHGATIEVASELAKGTCFWVWFPRLSSALQGGSDGQGADHR
jgi:signal transduction histidine kinase